MVRLRERGIGAVAGEWPNGKAPDTLDLMGSDVEDVVAMITSLPQSKDLFAGQPEDKVEAAIHGLRNGFAPYAGPEGVVMSGTAWLLTARS